ncbi:hypothetical protein ES703_119433 [subsurface metagenome]
MSSFTPSTVNSAFISTLSVPFTNTAFEYVTTPNANVMFPSIGNVGTVLSGALFAPLIVQSTLCAPVKSVFTLSSPSYTVSIMSNELPAIALDPPSVVVIPMYDSAPTFTVMLPVLSSVAVA